MSRVIDAVVLWLSAIAQLAAFIPSRRLHLSISLSSSRLHWHFIAIIDFLLCLLTCW